MKKKLFRERRKEAEGIIFANKGINFKVDDIDETKKVKPKKKTSKKKEA